MARLIPSTFLIVRQCSTGYKLSFPTAHTRRSTHDARVMEANRATLAGMERKPITIKIEGLSVEKTMEGALLTELLAQHSPHRVHFRNCFRYQAY